MLTDVFPQFIKEFPHITVEPKEINVKTQISMIAKRKLDLGFIIVPYGFPIEDEYIHIINEEIVLAVPFDNPVIKGLGGVKQIDLHEFAKENFVIIYKESSLRPLIDSIFRDSGFIPNILFETSNNNNLVDMVSNGSACTLIPKIYAKPNDKIRYFTLPSHPHTELVALYSKGRYLSKASRYLIELAKKYWTNYPYYEI
ncbi:MAG: LysR family transcriptional regulator substrate-binding protein [Lachnospiraceae bacterium]|nr:LysR family transcriptional regulator substrate-binding protein [Lachnospiraceae bacterium]